MIGWRTNIVQSFMLIYHIMSTKGQKETKAKGKEKLKGKEMRYAHEHTWSTRHVNHINQFSHARQAGKHKKLDDSRIYWQSGICRWGLSLNQSIQQFEQIQWPIREKTLGCTLITGMDNNDLGHGPIIAWEQINLCDAADKFLNQLVVSMQTQGLQAMLWTLGFIDRTFSWGL